jgi:hypothetical protein
MKILPLHPNKHVSIFYKKKGVYVVSNKKEVTPGAYTEIITKTESWYKVEVCCRRIGLGIPGLWIGDKNKNTLFYGDFFEDYENCYLSRKFYTSSHDTLLIGILIKNSAKNYGFFLTQLEVTFEINPPEKIKNVSSNDKEPLKEKEQEIEEIEEKEEEIEEKEEEIEEKEEKEEEIEEDNKKKSGISGISGISVSQSHNFCDCVFKIKESNKDYDICVEIKSISFSGKYIIYPIGWSVPEEIVKTILPEKTIDFFPGKIGDYSLEYFSENPDNYWDFLRKSKFMFVFLKKSGFQCLEVVEGLSQGCLPIFLDETQEKRNIFLPTSHLEPVKGVNIGWIDDTIFSYEEYIKRASFFLNYTLKYLTTKSMVQYMLSVVAKNVKKVLFLSYVENIEKMNNDYLFQESLVHGFKTLLGSENVLDYPKVESLYKNGKSSDYRLGIPYSRTLKDIVMDRNNLSNRINKKEFDIVIVMGCFTEEDQKRLKISRGCFPYGGEIENNYDKSEIVFVNSQENIKNEDLKKFIHRGIFFTLPLVLF